MTLDTTFGVLLYILLVISTGKTARACDSPLGMEDSRIKDDQISALTWLYFDKSYTRYYRPHFARLNYKKGGGGWCSEEHERYPGQYLEIDLGVDRKITSIGTQGRHGGNEWVDEYGIIYKRDNDTQFRQYSENGRWKIFIGNNDTETEVRNVFKHPVIARRIRIVPQGNYFTIYCMRLELYGCRWKKEDDGLAYYYASGIGKVLNGISMVDKGYDGTKYPSIGFITHGLGQLTDDIYGTSNLQGKSPSPWVGFNNPHPVLIFKFHVRRKFSMIKFHTLNKGQHIKVFSKVEIEVSNDGKNFTRPTVYSSSSAERLSAGAFKISVGLGRVVCQYIKAKFTQQGSWIAISEVDFSSEKPHSKSKENEIATATKGPKIIPVTKREEEPEITPKRKIVTYWPNKFTIPDLGNTIPDQTPNNNNDKDGENQAQNTVYKTYAKDDGSSSRGLSFPIVVAIVLGALVIAVIMVVLIVRKIRQVKKLQRAKQPPPAMKPTNELLGEYPKYPQYPPNMPPSAQPLVQPVVIQMNGSVQYKTKLLDSGYTSTGSGGGSAKGCRSCDCEDTGGSPV